jgi:S-adenosylmethionine decarboxylase
MKALGSHLILELYDCPAGLLDDPTHVADTMVRAVEASGATMIQPFFHQFAPQGVSGVVIISESHFAIHTWPEYGYAALDVFTCGDVIDMDTAADTLRDGFQAGSVQKMMFSRGMLNLPEEMIRHKPEEAPAAAAGGQTET